MERSGEDSGTTEWKQSGCARRGIAGNDERPVVNLLEH